MFGLVRKKTLVAALKASWSTLETAEIARISAVADYLELKGDVTHLTAAVEAVEHQRDVAMKVAASAEKERDKAVEDYKALEKLHSRRVRVGTFTVSPERLTARLRAIEPSLRVEFDGDKVVIYSDQMLKPEVGRAVRGLFSGQWDTT